MGVLIGVVGSGDAKDSPVATVTVTAAATGADVQAGAASSSTTVGPQHKAASKGEIPGDGTFLVGQDVQAGTYRSEGKNKYSCYWARLSDTSGEGDAIIANGVAEGPAIVKVAAGDKAFQTTDCKPWTKIG
ncbi:hypothetical protein [Streptomyces griseorubiginosus]|uniref:hypothetical protein n=1 Tax=Streptomyces griseorubiginosus TaxID=67304 RepID=UPI0036EC9B65